MAPPVSSVGHVILGFLTRGPMSGYDIKQVVDHSTRFFFAAGYGQIYPELKKLHAEGLITGIEKSQGARSRTEYTLTPAGHVALTEWVLEPVNKIDMRDEGLVRLFFADDLPVDQRIAKIRSLQEERRGSLAVLEEICDTKLIDETTMPNLVLIYGLGLHQFVIDWCDWAIARLENPETPAPPPPGIPSLVTSPKE
jgi:DNA-binding PadR family transcriptional regulator